MSGDPVLLGGVPKPFSIEAASSWLSRLALAQGCTVRELLRFLNLRSDEDLDVQLRGHALSELRRKCGLPGSHSRTLNSSSTESSTPGFATAVCSPTVKEARDSACAQTA